MISFKEYCKRVDESASGALAAASWALAGSTMRRHKEKQQNTSVKPLTPYQQGKADKAAGKSYSNPHPFDAKSGADVNYNHNSYKAGFNESVELDEAEGLTTKKNQNGGHDVYHNGTHIGHVEQKTVPWLRGKTIKKVFAKKPNGDSVVVDSDDTGKNTIESAKKTLLKHHLAESTELDESASRFIQKVNQAANAAASGKHKNAQMHLDNARTFMLGVKSTDMSKIHDAHETYKNLRKKYSGSGGNFTPSHNQVGNAKVTSESEELDESANIPVDKVHKHVQEFMGMSTSTKLANHMKTGTAKHVSWGKVNDGLKAIGVKPQHIATLAARIKPAQYAEQEQSSLVEAIKNWKHAHGDLMKSRSASSNASKPVHLHRLTSSGAESKMEGPQGFSSEEDAQKHVDNMHKMNPGKKFSYNKYVDGKHVGVVTKSTNESIELDEATFVSSSPATYGSSGVKFDVQKNKEKSVGEHANGQPKEHHDVYHEGKHIGHVSSYSGYKDKKPAGSRIVTSRKDVRHWQVTVHGGEHNRHGSHWDSTPENSQYTQTGFASKKDALQHLADAHKSNKKR